jgi:hypothetical protein
MDKKPQVVGHIYDSTAKGVVVKTEGGLNMVKWDGQQKLSPCMSVELVWPKREKRFEDNED